MTKKIVVAKPGFNVLSETNPNNLAFSSDYNTLKYYLAGSLSLSVNIGANLFYARRASIAHNLGYSPFYVVYVKDDLMANYQPVGRFQAGSGAYRSFIAYVTPTKLYVSAYGYSGASGDIYTVNFYYKIFKNNLGL